MCLHFVLYPEVIRQTEKTEWLWLIIALFMRMQWPQARSVWKLGHAALEQAFCNKDMHAPYLKWQHRKSLYMSSPKNIRTHPTVSHNPVTLAYSSNPTYVLLYSPELLKHFLFPHHLLFF